MRTHIAKVYKFTYQKFLEFCKEVYVPEEKTVKRCPNKHRNSHGKFCKDCGSVLTEETIEVKKTNGFITDYVWDELNCNSYFAITNISDREKQIEFFHSIEHIEENKYMSMTDINNAIEIYKTQKDEWEYKLEKYCESFDYGIINFYY